MGSCRRTSRGWRLFARALDEVHDEDESWLRTVSSWRPVAGRFIHEEVRPRSAPPLGSNQETSSPCPARTAAASRRCCSIAGLRARDAAPPPGLVLDGGVVAVPRTLIHVAQQPYCPLHAVPLAWATTRVEADVDAVAALLDALDFYPGARTNKTLLTEEQDDFLRKLVGRPARQV